MTLTLREKNKLCELLEIILDPSTDAELCGTEREWMMNDIPKQSWETCRIKTANNAMHQLLWLLRECLLTHRWCDVLNVFKGVLAETNDSLQTQWRVGCELVMKEGGDGVDLMHQFINQVKQLPGTDTWEVILEFVIYLIKHGRLDEASCTLQNPPRRHKNTTQSARLQPLLKAYQGLIHYTEWLNSKDKIAELHTDESNLASSQQTMASAESWMNVQAQRARNCFSCLTHTPGVWDIFIDKHVTILEHYDELGEAEKVLMANCETNSTNPNSHRYLLHFYRRYRQTHNLLPVLQNMVKLIPSDPEALELVNILKEDHMDTCVPVLFNLLDHHAWQDDIAAWGMLHDLLVHAYFSHEATTAIREAWLTRRTWWPRYHFHGRQLDQLDEHLVSIQAAVAVLLMGPQNNFSTLAVTHVGLTDDIQMAKQLYNSEPNIIRC